MNEKDIVISFLLLIQGFLCFYFGTRHERMKWNKLIAEGKINKPNRVEDKEGE